MRITFIFLISVLLLGGCVAQNATEPNATAGPVAASNSSGAESPEPTPPPVPKPKYKYEAKAGDLKVNVYRNGELVHASFYRNSHRMKYIAYDNHDGHDFVVDLTDGGPMAAENEQAEKDFLHQLNFLRSKDIEFPFPELVVNDISDIAQTLGAGDDHNDFQKDVVAEDDKKTIRFIGFNKTGRYHNSPVTWFTENGDFIHINDYELVVKNKYPITEMYVTDIGKMTKTFSYKNGTLSRVEYRFVNLKNQTTSETTRFEYKTLNNRTLKDEIYKPRGH